MSIHLRSPVMHFLLTGKSITKYTNLLEFSPFMYSDIRNDFAYVWMWMSNILGIAQPFPLAFSTYSQLRVRKWIWTKLLYWKPSLSFLTSSLRRNLLKDVEADCKPLIRILHFCCIRYQLFIDVQDFYPFYFSICRFTLLQTCGLQSNACIC